MGFLQILIVTPKDDSTCQSIAAIAKSLDWTVNRVSSSEEMLECFHKGNGLVPAVALVDCRYQHDKTVDAHEIARYVVRFCRSDPKHRRCVHGRQLRSSSKFPLAFCTTRIFSRILKSLSYYIFCFIVPSRYRASRNKSKLHFF